MHKSFIELTEFIKSLYPDQNPVPLHAPVFLGNEKKYLSDCIDSTFVSYVGKYVTRFEGMIAEYTGAKYAVAVVNGTAALQIALQVANVQNGEEVITQALTFVATANAITHAGGKPVFIDVDSDTMGMSPKALEEWLSSHVMRDKGNGFPINKQTKRRISAIVPMHTFGHPCRIIELREIADFYNIPLIEDSAESLGSSFEGQFTGTFGLAGILSFNGNKTITTGGGGMILTNDELFAKRAKHITTTAKITHRWEFDHDQIGWNYRLPNVNSAIGVAQMERIHQYLADKRETAKLYLHACSDLGIAFIDEPQKSVSNYWLNAILLDSVEERDLFLQHSNDSGVITRPVWKLMSELEMFKDCQHGCLERSVYIRDRLVNLPSGVKPIISSN